MRPRPHTLRCVLLLGLALSGSGACVRPVLAAAIELVSAPDPDSDGQPGPSQCPSLSADGRFVAFVSSGSDLVVGDANLADDVFVRDRLLGVTQRVSVSTFGDEANGGSYSSSISADGRFIAFTSEASNLVPDDTNGTWDVFLRDRLLGTTDLVSVSTEGQQGDRGSLYPVITPDGRFIAFESSAGNLVGRDTDGLADIFLRDRLLGTTELVSVGDYPYTYGSPSISGDARFIAFTSTIYMSTGVSVCDRLSQSTCPLAHGDDPSITGDGHLVAFY